MMNAHSVGKNLGMTEIAQKRLWRKSIRLLDIPDKDYELGMFDVYMALFRNDVNLPNLVIRAFHIVKDVSKADRQDDRTYKLVGDSSLIKTWNKLIDDSSEIGWDYLLNE